MSTENPPIHLNTWCEPDVLADDLAAIAAQRRDLRLSRRTASALRRTARRLIALDADEEHSQS